LPGVVDNGIMRYFQGASTISYHRCVAKHIWD
jgi:hypothetical protein